MNGRPWEPRVRVGAAVDASTKRRMERAAGEMGVTLSDFMRISFEMLLDVMREPAGTPWDMAGGHLEPQNGPDKPISRV